MSELDPIKQITDRVKKKIQTMRSCLTMAETSSDMVDNRAQLCLLAGPLNKILEDIKDLMGEHIIPEMMKHMTDHMENNKPYPVKEKLEN